MWALLAWIRSKYEPARDKHAMFPAWLAEPDYVDVRRRLLRIENAGTFHTLRIEVGRA
jgi:hypothetical protein